jgi:proton-translocating NADH-quinone oxidoreductase chain M
MLFFSILVLFSETFSTKFYILYSLFLSYDKECFLFVLSFLAFSVKVPMFPFHVWLPEAHVEAPTSGSVILAGLLLKLGAYGCIRILLPIYPIASNYFFPVISLFCVLSVIYASLTAIRQTDLKRIIAYSSVAHMNVVLIGVFSCNIYGIQGSVFLMLSHGVVSSALFFMVGILYRQHSTRLLNYYGGLSSKMPLFSTYLVLFCLANVGTPGSCNFIGELLIFVSLVDKNFFVLVVTMLSVVLSVSYTLWFFNRLVFGTVNTNFITD